VYSLGLYRRLLSIHVRGQMQYRLSFWMDVLATAIGNGVFFVTIALVLQTFDGIGGWKLGEVAFLYGMVETAFGIMDMLFSGFDPQSFGKHVRLGSLDQMMLRPAGLTLQVLGSEFIVRRLGRILQGLVVLGLALSWVDMQWTPLKVLYLPLVIAGMVSFFGGLFIIGATITFWTVESIEVINILTYGGVETITYPMHIYPNWLVRFFTFIVPAIFLNYYPALYFLDKPDPFNAPAIAPFLSPLVSLAVLLAGLAFWRYGLRHYQSTGT
jgi:ABC-2 type transport system permease protein